MREVDMGVELVGLIDTKDREVALGELILLILEIVPVCERLDLQIRFEKKTPSQLNSLTP